MQVAAQTVGLDLVPVVPMQGPMGVLTYLDFVYGGGRIQDAGGKATDSAPLLIKVDTGADVLAVNDLRYASSAALAGTVAPYRINLRRKIKNRR